MTQFDESKVINALHPEKAEVGKKYWYADSLIHLKKYVEDNDTERIAELKQINNDYDYDGCIFQICECYLWQFLYPYEEPSKQRMTNRQLAEWCNRGNGQWKLKGITQCLAQYSYSVTKDNNEVGEAIHIRSWGSEEWIEPTVGIYLRDCKGEDKNEEDR